MALLTDRQLASGVTVNDLIHIVITGDTSQNPAGSSYKATIQQVASALTGVTGTSGSSGSSGSSGVSGTSGSSGSSGSSGISGIGLYLPLSGGTVTGTTYFGSGLSANTFSAVTIGSSSNCVTDLYVLNVHSCSPLNINPLNEGDVVVGTTGVLTVDLTNSRVGINTKTPGYSLMVSGTTSRFWYDPTFFSGRVQVSGDTGLPSYYATIGPYLTKSAAGYQFGIRAWDDTSFPGYGKVGDSFVYASNESNGLNLINGPGTGTDDYIRFYAGKNATSTPDVHIQGSGTTKGFVGIGTETPRHLLDVNGSGIIQNGLSASTISATTISATTIVLSGSNITSSWTTYTPAWTTDGGTQPVLGDGSITGAYKIIGKTCFFRVRLFYGSTTTGGSGTFYFSLPVVAANSAGLQFPCSILDNGNAWYQAIANGEFGGFTDKIALIGQSAGGANSSQSITGTFPITFGNLDSIQFAGSYEIA